MNYDKDKLAGLLDKPTIKAIMNILDIRLKHLAVRLGGVTIQAIKYRMDNEKWEDWQRSALLDLFFEYGICPAEMLLIHQIVSRKKGAKL